MNLRIWKCGITDLNARENCASSQPRPNACFGICSGTGVWENGSSEDSIQLDRISRISFANPTSWRLKWTEFHTPTRWNTMSDETSTFEVLASRFCGLATRMSETILRGCGLKSGMRSQSARVGDKHLKMVVRWRFWTKVRVRSPLLGPGALWAADRVRGRKPPKFDQSQGKFFSLGPQGRPASLGIPVQSPTSRPPHLTSPQGEEPLIQFQARFESPKAVALNHALTVTAPVLPPDPHSFATQLLTALFAATS